MTTIPAGSDADTVCFFSVAAGKARSEFVEVSEFRKAYDYGSLDNKRLPDETSN